MGCRNERSTSEKINPYLNLKVSPDQEIHKDMGITNSMHQSEHVDLKEMQGLHINTFC